MTVLSAPISSTQYLTQSSYDHLSATYSPNSTDVSNGFQGWEVYYKIYPQSTATTSSNLAADVASLAATPTRDYLVNLGYQRMNGSNLSATTVPLIGLQNYSSSGATVTLSFVDFLADYNANPIATPLGSATGSVSPYVQVGTGSTTSVFRTITTSGSVTYPYFNQLYSSTFSQTSDMSSAITSASVTPCEIDVFLIGYAFTLSKTTYSQPEPWGVIKPLDVP